MMYARAPQGLVITLTALSVTLWVALFMGVRVVKDDLFWLPLIGTRLVDVVLAPVFAIRENQRLRKKGIDIPAGLPPILVGLLMLLLACFAIGIYTATVMDKPHFDEKPSTERDYPTSPSDPLLDPHPR
jgi:hypothetical protein